VLIKDIFVERQVLFTIEPQFAIFREKGRFAGDIAILGKIVLIRRFSIV